MSAYFPAVRTSIVSQSNGIFEIARRSSTQKDFGFVGCYNTSNYAGIVRYAADGKFYIFDKLTTSPFVSDSLASPPTPAALVVSVLTTNAITSGAITPLVVQNSLAAPIISFDPVALTATTSRSIITPNIMRTVSLFTANVTLTINNGVCQFDCSAGPLTVTLPAAIVAAGIQLYFIKIDASNNALTIMPTFNDNIDGVSAGSGGSISLTNQWTHTTVLCGGATIGWFSI